MGLSERIGIDFGRKLRLEDALEGAAAKDHPPNELDGFDEERVRSSGARSSATA